MERRKSTLCTNEKNAKLGLTVDEARKMLGILITDVYFDIKRNSTIPNVKVLTEECSPN